MATAFQVITRPSSRCFSRLSTVVFAPPALLHSRRMPNRGFAMTPESLHPSGGDAKPSKEQPLANSPPIVIPAAEDRVQSPKSSDPNRLLDTAQPGAAPPPPRPRPRLKASKAAMTLTPGALEHLRSLLSGPNPKYIRVGVKNKGCAGMSYHLEYVDKPGKFDEKVEQDGVTVLIDSKALFSIIGSEMDWVEDKLSSKFAFTNPNIKDACGCGESFNVQPAESISSSQ